MPILTTYTRADHERWYAGGYWTSDTLVDALERAAAIDPSRCAIVDGDRRITYGELRTAVDEAAAGLRAAGIDREDAISIQLPNSIELATLILAAARIGAIYNPLNPGYRRREVETITGLVRPRAIVVPDAFRGFRYPELAEEATADLEGVVLRLCVGTPPSEAWTRYEDLLARGRDALAAGGVELGRPDPDAVFLLGATSGTTGNPKVYVHTANTQLQEACQLNRTLGFDERDVFLAMAPMTHRGALMYGFLTAIAAGARLVVVQAYDPPRVLDLFQDEGITAFMAIPTQVIDLLDLQAREPRDTSSLKLAMLSGAPIPEALVGRFEDAWPTCTPISGYGMSECGYATLTRPDDPRDKLFTSGKPGLGMEIQIRGEDGAPLPAGEVGQIHIRGPYVCAGYFGDQEATRAAIDRDGWLGSGDLGFLDEDGYILPVGRLKHVIIRGGLKIHAEEIEFLLGQHEATAASCVVGIPDDRLGERATACVVLRDGAELDLEGIQAFLEEKGVTKLHWPERVVPFDAFPLTPVGKIDRRGIRARALAELGIEEEA